MSVSDLTPNALQVLEKRYLKKDSEGKVCETPEDMLGRVAGAIAQADAGYDDADVKETTEKFLSMMEELRFLPNSPTLMNAGRPLGQLSACFVLPVEDTMEGIFETIKQAALIHKSGGGTGFSFSRLRPAGSMVNSTGGVASGPISFMRVFNMATEAVKQGGTRRGANMGILRVDHPDILSFIDCKKSNADIVNFNISVGITESFMQAVQDNTEYELVDPHNGETTGKLKARDVFHKIVDNAWLNGEPGIIFLDRLNRDNVVPGQGEIESTNPCGEQPLLPYESCNLGSINLYKMLRHGEDGAVEIDTAKLRETVVEAVHFLDNVIDVNNYPIETIGVITRRTRKIGLGVMGFADMLLELGIPYDSDEAVQLADMIMEFISRVGREASRKLAKQRGPFELFYESIYKDGEPLRNGTITTIAPTGTLSIIAGCSSGVEPVFAFAYERNVMDGTRLVEVNPILKKRLEDAGLLTDELLAKIVKEGTIAHIDEIPEEIRRVFRCAHDIAPEYHIKIQAAFQKNTDNAVSKTVNFRREATKAEVAETYLLAYKLGCKGVTIYRDGSRENQVLSIKGDDKAAAPEKTENDGAKEKDELSESFGHIMPRERPAVTKGFTERVRTGCGNLYITVNYDEKGICEVFTSTGKAGGCPSQSEATARLVSIALRSGISVDEIYAQLKGIRCPSTIRVPGLSCTSCPDAIAKAVRKVAEFQNGSADDVKGSEPPKSMSSERAGKTQESEPVKAQAALKGCEGEDEPESEPEHKPVSRFFDGGDDENEHVQCPECGSELTHEGGCVICRNCGYSKCG